MQLDDLQLDEPDSSSPHYKVISDIKSDLKAATDIIDGRLDLIEKVDASKVGWAAAAVFEKTNGPITKADSEKLWAEAEKSVGENRKKEVRPQPFHGEPAQAGKDHVSFRSQRGSFSTPFVFLCFLLCFVLAPFLTGYTSVLIFFHEAKKKFTFIGYK